MKSGGCTCGNPNCDWCGGYKQPQVSPPVHPLWEHMMQRCIPGCPYCRIDRFKAGIKKAVNTYMDNPYYIAEVMNELAKLVEEG